MVPSNDSKQGGYFIAEELLEELKEARNCIDMVCDLSDRSPDDAVTTINVNHLQSLLGTVKQRIDAAIDSAEFTVR